MTQLTQAQIEQRREAARARWRGYAKVGAGVLAAAAAVAGAGYLSRGRSRFRGFGSRGATLPTQVSTKPAVKPASGRLSLQTPVDLAARQARGTMQYSTRWAARDAGKWSNLPEVRAPFQAKRPDTWGLQAQHRQSRARERLAQIDEVSAWRQHRERVAQSAAEGAKYRAASSGAQPLRRGKTLNMDEVRARLASRLQKRQAGTPLSEAERQQRSEAAKARWREHRGTTVANDTSLNSKGFPRQRAASASRPRDESGRVRPLNADEISARLEQRAAKIRAGKVGARWDARGNLRDKSGSFTSHPWAGAIGEEAASHLLGPSFAPIGRKVAESLAVEAENKEHRGALIGGGLGAGAAAAISSKPVKRFVGRQIGSLIGRYKIKGRIAGAIGGKTGRILARGIAGRTNVKGSGLLIGSARSLLSRRLIGVPLVGAGVYLGSRAGRLFQDGKR